MATWKVSTHYKKSCEEHEYFVKDGQTIVRVNGFRWATFTVETTDNSPPQFEFDCVPGGDGRQDSVDMYNCAGPNIENVELDMMDDGWYSDIRFPDDMDEEEQERLQELIDEEGVYGALEEIEGWQLDETQAWIWGPILIEDENNNQVKIVVADESGNCVEFKD